jgi:flagellar hook assembly protein FlgD
MPANAIDELSSGSSFMLQNFPNPFSGETKIRFMMRHSSSSVILQIYDMTGNEVAVLREDKLDQGVNEIRWDAAGCKPGVYYIRLKTDESIETIKAVLFN